MSNIVPFDPPRMFRARLKAGFVDVSTIAVDGYDDNADVDCSTAAAATYHRGWDNATAATYYPSIRTNTNTNTTTTSPTIPVPLERTETTSGKIMEITVNSSSSQPPVVVAFWLLRKLGHHPIVRLGYKLRLRSKNNNYNDDDEKYDDQNQNLRWELDTDELGRLTLLRIHIFHCSILNDDEIMMPEDSNTQDDDAGVVVNSSLNELSALQLIAKQTQQQSSSSSSSSCSIFPRKTKAHVVGTELIATTTTTASDDENNKIYAVLPYYRDGTLLQFCQSIGSPLDESLARYIFRQIIQGLKTLKATGLCHRNLSLDAIAMDGDHFDIIGLGWTLRVTDDNSSSSSSSSRVMVRAAGLMLYSMVVGTNSLFFAPIAGDKIFTRLCIKGDIRGEVERYGKQLGQDYSNLLSNDLLDLLRTTLRADPKQRLSLEEVMEHPWVTNDDLIITPTQWMEKKKKSII